MQKLQKTPISELKEYADSMCLRHPEYQLVYSGTTGSSPLFRYVVKFNGQQASGESYQKQQAKQNAAHNLLCQLKGVQPEKLACREPNRPVAQHCTISMNNPIGNLNELCALKKYPTPVYKELGFNGPPHARLFTMECSVSDITEKGQRSSKQAAKHDAAQKVYARLSQETSVVYQVDVLEPKVIQTPPDRRYIEEKYVELSRINPSQLTNGSLKFKDFYKAMTGIYDKSSTLKRLIFNEELIPLDSYYALALQIGEELNCDISSTPLKINPRAAEMSLKNSDLMLISLPASPTVYGVGMDNEDAAENMIKILTELAL